MSTEGSNAGRKITGAVLAAGSGSRMGTPKGELVVNGVRLVDRAVAALRGAGCFEVIPVVRAGVAVDGAVVNPAPERGLRSSLELAVEAARGDAMVVLLADMPGIDAVGVGRVIDAWRPGRIGLASYGTEQGHPIVMSLAFWRSALELAGPDEGARRFLARSRDIVDTIEVEGQMVDLDSPADLSAWLNRE